MEISVLRVYMAREFGTTPVNWYVYTRKNGSVEFANASFRARLVH